MDKKIIEVNEDEAFKGAKINLTVDISPEDCEVMCKQMFEKLNDIIKMQMIETYFESKGIKFCPLEIPDEKTN